jgi:hypothetical protein
MLQHVKRFAHIIYVLAHPRYGYRAASERHCRLLKSRQPRILQRMSLHISFRRRCLTHFPSLMVALHTLLDVSRCAIHHLDRYRMSKCIIGSKVLRVYHPYCCTTSTSSSPVVSRSILCRDLFNTSIGSPTSPPPSRSFVRSLSGSP